MNRQQKFEMVKDMSSQGQLTSGRYPSGREFFRALSTGRVAGTYGPSGLLVITSNDPLKSYTFRGQRISAWIRQQREKEAK